MRHVPGAYLQRAKHGVVPRHPQPPAESTPNKILRYAQTAQQVAGIAHSIYKMGQAAAPYVGAAVAAL